MKQIKIALTRMRQLIPQGSATSLRHFSRMSHGLLATALFISFCCLLAADITMAADTGRRCCVYVMLTPEGDPLRSKGVTYLKEKNQMVMVGSHGNVGIVDNPMDTFCAEVSKTVKDLQTIPRPLGERCFQGVTNWGSHEESVLILEIPTMNSCAEIPDGATGNPVLHNLDLTTREIIWSKEFNDEEQHGPFVDFGGGITWIPDDSPDGGVFLISLTSEHTLARYEITHDGTIQYLNTITLPVSLASNDHHQSYFPAYNMNGLGYTVRHDGVRELWAHYASNIEPAPDGTDRDDPLNPQMDDYLFAYELGEDGEIIGTEPLGGTQVMAERGSPSYPSGVMVLNKPNPDSTKARVFLASGNKFVYELWYKRYGSRFAPCPWKQNPIRGCCTTGPNQCQELFQNECNATGGYYDSTNWKYWGSTRNVCADNPCGFFPWPMFLPAIIK